MSNTEWIALQHRCWIKEIAGYRNHIAHLQHAKLQGVVAQTGKHARRPANSTQRIAREIESTERHIAGMLDDYGRYFRDAAALAFTVFLTARAPADVTGPLPHQSDLFDSIP